MPEPRHDELTEATPVQAIEGAASRTAYPNQPGTLEDTEVAGGRRPAMREARGQVSGRQLAAAVAEQDENVPARLVCQRREDRVQFPLAGPVHVRDT